MYKLLVTDVDGTLVKSDHKTLTQENIDAIKEMTAMGIQVSLASGRGFFGLKKLISKLDLEDNLHIADNGATLYHGKDEFELVMSIEPTAYKQLIDKFKKTTLSYAIYTSINAYYDGSDSMRENIALTHMGMQFDSANAYDVDNVVKVVTMVNSRSEAREFVSSMPDGVLGVQSGEYYDKIIIDCIPHNANKSIAAQRLAKELGIDSSEVICIGDQQNDIEMVKFAGLGLAVANAHKDLKKIADKVLDSSCDENPMQEVLKCIKQ